MKKPTPIGPWPLGIDNVSDPTSVRSDDKGRPIALCDAVNVDIDRSGDVERRRGPRLAVALPGLHSVWTGEHGSFGVAQGALYRLTAKDATQVGTLPSNEPTTYADVADYMVACQPQGLTRIDAAGTVPLAPPDGPMPALSAASIGGLHAGRYSVAIAYLRRGVEGALSPMTTLTLEEGQGIAVNALAASPEVDMARVYRTDPNGGVLYRCADMPLGLSTYTVGVGQLGRAATTQHLARMPGGTEVASWRGLLLVANGRTLMVSEPMNPGLRSPREGFVQFQDTIRMLAAVEGGVYVGTRRGVDFLRGSRPGEWTKERKGAMPPVRHGVTYIDGNQLPPSYQQAGRRVAIWLAANGFVLGCDDGSLIEPQGDRLAIGADGAASICALSRRVTATLS